MDVQLAIPEQATDPGERITSPVAESTQRAARFPERTKNQQSTKGARPPVDGKRKLVVCIDGTSNQFSEKNTNVVELYSRIDKNEWQHTYYNSGIGTYAKPSWPASYTHMKQVISNTVDLAITWNFEKVIIGAYHWLADIYQPKDQIYLFGFSRGAYQVRALAAMIETVGLIYPGNQEQIPFAWELYSNGDRKVGTFKRAFSRKEPVDLHFLGAWDTVSSIGITLGDLHPMTDQCKHITHFRHALALDECRVKYRPEHIVGSAKATGSKKEVWFAGTHSDIGGGNKPNEDLNLGAEPLRWMMEEAQIAGLSMREHDIKIGIPNADITRSLTGPWWLCEYAPIMSRRSYSVDGEKFEKKWTPHRGRGRKVLPSHQIHWTVRASLRKQSDGASGDKEHFTYKPKAELRRGDNAKLLWEAMLIERPEGSVPPGEQSPEAAHIPTWEGGKYLIDAIDLVKDGRSLEPLKQDESELWVEKLWDYLTKDGKPELIWTYGGPWLLHKVASIPQSRRARAIIRSVVGLKYDPESQVKKQKQQQGPSIPATDNKGASINEIDLNHLASYVTPRVCTLLQQWAADGPSPLGTSFVANNLLSKALAVFKLKSKTKDGPPPAEVDWNIRYIPEKDRSIRLARIAMDMVLDPLKIGEIQSIFSEDSEMIRIFVSLVSKNPVNQTTEDLDMTEAAVMVITTLAGNGNARQEFYYADAVPSIMPLLSVQLLKARFKLVTEVIRSLQALARNEDCAYEIADQPNFSVLLAFLEPQAQIEDQKQQQILVTDAVSTVAVLAEACQPRWSYEESRSEDIFPRIINVQVVDKLVQILAKKRHPAIDNVLRVMKIISRHRDHLLLTGDMPAVTHICDSVGVSLDALTILRNLVSYDYVRDMMIKKGVISHVSSLVESKDSELALMVLGFIEELLEHDDSRQELLKGDVASKLIAPLNSSQSELVEAALDVAVAITSQSDSVDDALVHILISLATKTKNHKAMLAIGGVAAHQKLDYGLGTLIPAFVTFMEDLDNTIVEDALNVLIKLVENDEHREEMLQAHIIQSITNLLEFATQSSSYYSPNTSYGRITITSKVFSIVEAMCKDSNIRAQIIGSPAIGFLYLLTDSPVSYTVDEEAIETLGRMKYEDVQAVLAKLDGERGMDVLGRIASQHGLSAPGGPVELGSPVVSGQDEQLGEAEEPEALQTLGPSRPATSTDGIVNNDPSRENSTDRLVPGSGV